MEIKHILHMLAIYNIMFVVRLSFCDYNFDNLENVGFYDQCVPDHSLLGVRFLSCIFKLLIFIDHP